MKYHIHLLQIFCFLIISISIQCQDYTWNGGNGSWNNPQNWSPSGVPQFGDEVFIAKGTVHVNNGYAAGAKFVEVHGTGGLTVHPNSSLDVIGNIGGEGILNYGLVETYGSIRSNNHSGGTLEGVGFRNYGKFYIYVQGFYSSTGCSRYGISNEQYALCANDGNIEIIDNGRGILNDGTFENSNSIFINELDLLHGITNHGDFNNKSGSSLNIQGNHEFGIITNESTLISQVPEFTNNGKISVDGSAWWCILVSDGTFVNGTNGSISLTNSTHSGLTVDGISTFNNKGILVSQGHVENGVKGIGNLINSGFIKSAYNGEGGIDFIDIWNPTIGSIVNSGVIESYENGDFDIYLEVELHNTDEGYIYTEGVLEGADIINDGIFSAWHDGISSIAFENNGVLEDVHNSLPNIQNNQIVVRPLNGPLTAGVVFFNALDKASSSNTTINLGWYDQLDNGNAAALYFFWTNSIFPNSNGASAPTMWLDATIQSSGQQRRLRVNVSNAALPLTQNSENTAFQSLGLDENPMFSIYPNPIVNSFRVDALRWSGESYVFKLYDVTGKEVMSKNVDRNARFELPYMIDNGLYFGVISDGKQIIYREKISVGSTFLNGS